MLYRIIQYVHQCFTVAFAAYSNTANRSGRKGNPPSIRRLNKLLGISGFNSLDANALSNLSTNASSNVCRRLRSAIASRAAYLLPTKHRATKSASTKGGGDGRDCFNSWSSVLSSSIWSIRFVDIQIIRSNTLSS